MRNEVLLVTGSRQFLFFTRHLIIIWIRKGRIQFFFLIYIRQETNGMEQPAGIECIVFFIFRIETADVHIAQRMYKPLITQINTDKRHAFLFVCRYFPAEEYKITRLYITEIGSNTDTLPHISLL